MFSCFVKNIFVHEMTLLAPSPIIAEPPDYRLLRRLGYQTQDAAKSELKLIGRNGPLPWASMFFLTTLPYIQLTSFVVVPVAHLFLMGLLKTLLDALLSKSVPGHTVIFSEEQKEAVQVMFYFPIVSAACRFDGQHVSILFTM
jgi:hypothetical protein